MTDVKTVQAKYIFLDIVSYTQDRTIEAQSHIINELNKIVLEALDFYDLTDEKLILLPTGDGICIAIINIDEPYDVHIAIGLRILSGIEKHNSEANNPMVKFKIRIGINENTDNLIIDTNKNRNIAGAGINIAQRIMNAADDNQIFVSQTVYEKLHQRERYWQQFKPFNVTVKHGHTMLIYQYINSHDGLVTTPPAHINENIYTSDNKLMKMLQNFFK